MSLLDKIKPKKEVEHNVENNFRLNFGDQMIVGFDKARINRLLEIKG